MECSLIKLLGICLVLPGKRSISSTLIYPSLLGSNLHPPLRTPLSSPHPLSLVRSCPFMDSGSLSPFSKNSRNRRRLPFPFRHFRASPSLPTSLPRRQKSPSSQGKVWLAPGAIFLLTSGQARQQQLMRVRGEQQHFHASL